MKKVLTIGLVLAFVCTTMSVKSQQEMTQNEKFSYAIGANFGGQVRHDNLDLDLASFMNGVKDGIAGQNQFTDQQMQEIFMEFQKVMQEKQANAAVAAKADGIKFLEENKKNPDVKVTESGLQYKVITMGNGPKPTATSEVTVKYKGTLIVVKDCKKALNFYRKLFGFELLQDNDGNMELTGNLYLQEVQYWEKFIGRSVLPKSNSTELYFEEPDPEGFVQKLQRLYPETEFVNPLMTHSWGQRVVRFYDPDGNLIEVGTPV